ncbi:hypothetical protein KMP13_19350 [Epibacterium ulvae]|uniref:hypothetical protein n=1 Tax=Epibacterium ulvae TaxID=1156985 RepID=UPI001BFC235D|nr:hypothetical protein [Epibacterium ulvae]MBT8155978.1 hypothetical protein [Epibacterium ulvae]
MKKIISWCVGFILTASVAHADMSIELGGGWNGKRVPKGQQCTLFGGNGSTPPMKIVNLPSGTTWVHVEYNDRDYRPLSKNGGHGVIGYPVKGSSADIYSVPGLVGKLPGNAKVISASRTGGKYASDGYLPPCSGGGWNRYSAMVKAISSTGEVLEAQRVKLGRY